MILTLFESVQRAYTRKEQIIDADWSVIADFLTTFNQCANKKDMQLFNLWQFNPNGELGRRRIYENNEPTEAYETIPGTIRRCKANAEGLWGIILDFDGGTNIEGAVEVLNGFEFVLYTTFRNSPETNKFRVVLPFKNAATPEQVKRKKKSLSETFLQVDHASFSESQSFYLHSGPNTDNAIAFWCKGEFLDLDLFEDELIPERLEMPKQEFTGDRNIYKETLIESLATCNGLHYANEGTKHGVLTLVALCKSADFTFSEFDVICHNMADPTSSLQNTNLRKTAWMGWAPHSGITKQVREEFIKAHGGTSKFGIKEIPKTSEQLKQHIIQKYGSGAK